MGGGRIDERAGGERGGGASGEAERRPRAIDERAGGERGGSASGEAERRPRAITVGFVRGAHGIRGEIEVRTYDPDSRALRKGTDVWLGLEDAAETRRVLEVRTGRAGLIVRLEGVETRDAADALKGRTVEVERDALPKPDPGEFYLADLIGFRVETTTGQDVGELAGARENTAQRLLVVRGADGREVLVPAVPQILLRVEPERRVVVIDPPEGLLEL